MNILFLMKNFELGGIEVVSTVLARAFMAHGHRCAFFTLEEPHPMVRTRIPDGAALYVRTDKRVTKANVSALRKVLLDEQTDVIINQWGLPFAPTLIAWLARRGLGVRYISVYHNSPDTNARIQDVLMAAAQAASTWTTQMLKCKLWAVKLLSRWSMRYVYAQSDCYVLLSPSFVGKFCSFCHLPKESKLVTITNPLTLPEEQCIYHEELKQKWVICMGRMDHNQKRVGRVVDVWERLCRRFPDWQLHFVGDGPERHAMEQRVARQGLSNVFFDGFSQPVPYYESAAALIQTSEYEGFPLVLAEAMCFGVVPVIYGSYSAVYDIIEHGSNGLIAHYNPAGFDADAMASLLARVMEDADERRRLAARAAQVKQRYAVDEIYRRWCPVLGIDNTSE